jgi:transcriptional antiterminator RfaH
MNLPNDKYRSNEPKHDLQSVTKSQAVGYRLTACPEQSRGAGSSQRNGALSWYVVQSKPREEERALYFLKERGLETYLPRMEVAKIRGSKSVRKEKPLFPGYLFCRFNKEESVAHVRWTKGVKRILPQNVNPIPVEDEVVKTIHSLQQKDGIIRKQLLQKNDRIRIARGPMKDVLGIFEYWTSDRGRVRVLLNFVNYQASVNLHYSFIERVL